MALRPRRAVAPGPTATRAVAFAAQWCPFGESVASLGSSRLVAMRRLFRPALMVGLLLASSSALVPRAQPGEADPDARVVENVAAFARLYGVVRFFHPSDASAATDWDRLVVVGTRHVMGAPDRAALWERLEAVVRPVAPTVRVFEEGPPPPPDAATVPRPGEALVSWRHRGLATGVPVPAFASARTGRPGGLPSDVFRELLSAFPEPRAEPPATVRLGRGLVARVPVVLPDRGGSTARPTDAPPSDLWDAAVGAVVLDTLSAADPSVRLAAVVKAWAAVEHFSPRVDARWDGALATALGEALRPESGDAEAFRSVLERMLVPLRDGHAVVAHRSDPGAVAFPFRVAEVEGRPVVVAVVADAPEGLCVRVGDVLMSVGGRPAADLVGEAAARVSGSPQWASWRAHAEIGKGPPGSEARVAVERAGGVETCVVARSLPWLAARGLVERRPDPVAEVADGVWYVDLTRLRDGAVQAHLDQLVGARGIVFDVRGYPEGNVDLLRHLAADTVRSAWFENPLRSRPGAEDGWDIERWTLPPVRPRIGGRVAFLTDARAVSYAESFLGVVEHHGLGALVGAPTAGANGDVVTLRLPGRYAVRWTGLRVRRADGSPHPLAGIRPTVPVAPTLAGVRAGRDEALEAALEWVGAE